MRLHETSPELERCIPEKHTWGSLLRPMSNGGIEVLEPLRQCVIDFGEYLDRHLPAGWSIALGRNVLGISPDIICVHPQNGILLFEIRDWGDEIKPPEIDESGRRTSKDPVADLPDDPIRLLNWYRVVFSEIFSRLSDSETLITTVAVLPNRSDNEALQLLGASIPTALRPEGRNKLSPYMAIAGKEEIESAFVTRLLAVSRVPNLKLEPFRRALVMPDRSRERIKWLLRVPEIESELYKPLGLDRQKVNFLSNKSGATRRKVRGAVGSGKSTLLAACAAKAVTENKRVLIVSFTITLRHWLHMLIVRGGLNQPGVRQAEFSSEVKELVDHWYLHQFAANVIAADPQGVDLPRFLAASGPYPEKEIREMTERALSRPGISRIKRYDLILLDEAQNIHHDWVRILQKALKPGGEMVFFHDPTQNVYGTDVSWTNKPIEGFPERWTNLTESYRFPHDVLPVLTDFLEHFNISGEGVLRPMPAQGELFERVNLIWFKTEEADLAKTAVAALNHSEVLGFEPSDVALLCLRHQDGLRILTGVKDSGYEPKRSSHEIPGHVHIFHEDRANSQHLKLSFFPLANEKKLCTFHSFQGWQARYLILVIPPKYSEDGKPLDADFDFDRTIYVGLSRICRALNEPTVVVVNAERSFDSFFERHFRLGNLQSKTLL